MALVPTAGAAAGDGDGTGNRAIFGPYSSGSTDSGTCGNWASDTFKRVFYVEQSGSGSWRVTERFIDGHFVTLAGRSPGGCETSSPHGTAILAGVKGEFEGFLDGTVTSSTYNPAGCDVPGACGTTTGFILAVFGQPRSAFNDSTFLFDYHAQGEGLIYKQWVNASANLGGNRGDIASS